MQKRTKYTHKCAKKSKNAQKCAKNALKTKNLQSYTNNCTDSLPIMLLFHLWLIVNFEFSFPIMTWGLEVCLIE